MARKSASIAMILIVLCTMMLTGPVLAYDRIRMLCLVNRERVKRGLKPLGRNSALDDAAQLHSDEQAAMKTMTHSGKNGSTPAQRCKNAGYDWTAVAENVAYGYPDESVCMTKWMASPGHRANILKSNVCHFGSAVAYAGSVPYYTQTFGNNGSGGNYVVCPKDEEDDDSLSAKAVESVKLTRQYKVIGGKKVYV